MAYKVGDLVRVKGIAKEDPFKKLKVGLIAPVVHVWQNTEYPYQIQGYSECLHEQELELVNKPDVLNDAAHMTWLARQG